MKFYHKRKEDSQMKTKILGIVSVIATIAATLVATSACFWWVYQPEEPKSLRNL